MDDDSLSDLSSDLSSTRSLSPPQDYPSPVSSQDQEASNSTEHDHSLKRALDETEVLITKKRKIAEPKPRTTQYLDLSTSLNQGGINQKSQLDILLKVLRKRRKIVVIAGAGISVSAGSACI